MMKKCVMLGVLLFSLAGGALAQTSAHTDDSAPLLKELINDDWSFFVDHENNVYYIDFELIKENLKEIIITDPTGKIVYRDELWDLPVNAIYEIDFGKIGSGHYTVELHSYTRIWRKDVEVGL